MTAPRCIAAIWGLNLGKRARDREASGKWLFLAAAASACASPPAPAAPREPPRAPARATSESFDRDWAERTIWRVPVRVTLPDARGWRASTQGSFTQLEHAASHSRLVLRLMLAPRLVRPEQCESDARLARPSLPSSEKSSAIVERRSIAAPEGFDVRLVVGVEPSATNGVHGFALAVGAGTSRCYVAAFETESAGPRAAEEVADRLAVAVSGILEQMHVPNVDRRVSPPVGVK